MKTLEEPSKKTFLQILCLLLFVSALSFTVYKSYEIYLDFNVRNARVEAQARTESQKAANQLGTYLQEKMNMLQRFRDQLGSGEIRHDRLEQALFDKFSADEELLGMAIAFSQYEFPNRKLYALYIERSSGTTNLTYLPYDYTDGSADFSWYHNALDGPVWTEPYVEEMNDELMITYSIPFYRTLKDQSKKVIGVVTLDVSLKYFNQIIAKLEMGETGYAYALSEDGHFLSHPIKELVREKQTIFTVPNFIEDNFLQNLADQTSNGQKTGFEQKKVKLAKGGLRVWEVIRAVPGTKWTLVANFPLYEGSGDAGLVRQDFFQLIVGITLTLIALCFFFLRIRTMRDFHWNATWAIAAILFVALLALWISALNYHDSGMKGALRIGSASSLNSFLQSRFSAEEQNVNNAPITVPTGVYLQSLEFKSSNNIDVTGYIWQKYPNTEIGRIAKVARGFILPDAVQEKITKKYERINSKGEIVHGWYFEATLRQFFDYAHYPFDRKKVWIRFWHEDFDKNVVIVPDIASYEQFNAEALPGVDESIVLSQWDIRSSDFYFVQKNYSTNFGIESYQGQLLFPELYYTVSIDRKFLGPFILYILPFMAIAALLFAWLSLQKSDGVSFLSGSSALLFTVLMAHYSLRESLDVSEIVYMEYFYFTMYISILILLFLNTTRGINNRLLQYFTQNNFILCRLMYWPVLLISLIIITFITYY